MAHSKFWNQHYSFHRWSLQLSRMLGNIFAFLTLFSIGKTLLFAAICWKSLLCLSPSLHNQISSLKFPASSPRREGEAAWTQTYGFLQIFFLHPCKEDSFGSIPTIHWSNTAGAKASTLCNSWGSWQTWIWRNAVASQRAWQSHPSRVIGAEALTTSQSSSSQIPLTILTPNLSPLYTFSAVPLTTHTHTQSPRHR